MNPGHEIRYEAKPYARVPGMVSVIARCTCGCFFEQRAKTEAEARELIQAPVNLHMRETRA